MDIVLTLLAVAGIVFGLVAVVEANGKSWSGWGVICVAAYVLIQRVT
jgi:hypothetical protein